MSFLVPVTKLDVSYHGQGRYLLIQASGVIPGAWLTPFIQQEEWIGGLKFSIRTHAGGLGRQPGTKPFSTDFRLQINLPIVDFNSKTVLVDTLGKTWDAPITYIEWPGPEDPENSDDSTKDLETSFSQTGWLPDGGELVITAKIPPSSPGLPGGPGSSVEISYNKVFFTQVSSHVHQGELNWTLSWKKLPTGEYENPQLVDVTQTTWQGGVGPEYPPHKVIQPYNVYFIVFEENKQGGAQD
ncbi:hypothetical protein QBC35DRAFT_437802 [Podospora australis]|uniref:Uncharacterized protein n=1 Tax=Podospora australis TaxID=1536484 RepID=A0AAN6WTK2_9PEZI|nr:hypothetical protein QBC35DRAFT_437802 [Podospora australis]